MAVVLALKVDRHKLIGHLHEFWWWALDNAKPDGSLGKVSDATIAEAAGWPAKQASMFVGALLDAGFLQQDETGVSIHDWYDFAGKLNDQRELRRVQRHSRRARIRASVARFTMAEWRSLCAQASGRCLCCRRLVKLTPDHVVPLARGGSNAIENIQPLCLSCNSRKGSKTIDFRPGP